MSEVEKFFKSIDNTAANYFTSIGINICEANDQKIEGIKFYDISSYISLTGVIKGGFILSVEKQLADALVPKFILDDLTDEEIPGFASEVVAEISNMISANSLIEREVEDIFLGTPLMILGNSARLNNITAGTLAKNYITQNGQFQCIFVPALKGSELEIKIDNNVEK